MNPSNIKFAFLLNAILLLLVQVCYGENIGLDQTLADPYFGENLTFNRLPFITNGQIQKIGYYVLAHNRSGLSSSAVPLIIGNSGSNGVANFMWLWTGVGPYKIDHLTNKISNQKYSITKFADFLLPEFPINSGWSSGAQVRTVEENSADFLSFMIELQKKHSNINKSRPIYFYANSFGSTVAASMAGALKTNGYNVKGALFVAPYGSMSTILAESSDNLDKHNSIGWLGAMRNKYWASLTRMALGGNILGSHWQTEYTLSMPTEGFWSSFFPTDIEGNLVKKLTDSRESQIQSNLQKNQYMQRFMENDNVRTQFDGGLNNMKAWNSNVLKAMFLTETGNETENWGILYQRLLDDNIKVVLMEGEYDYPSSLESTMEWVDKIAYANAGWQQRHDWTKKNYGRAKTLNNLCVAQVYNAGQYVAEDQPAVVYQALKNLIGGSSSGFC